jgi:hypothetical protein
MGSPRTYTLNLGEYMQIPIDDIDAENDRSRRLGDPDVYGYPGQVIENKLDEPIAT